MRTLLTLASLFFTFVAQAQTSCSSAFVSPGFHHVSYVWTSGRPGLISLALRVTGPRLAATVAQGTSSIQGRYRLDTSAGGSFVFTIVETFSSDQGVQTAETPVYTAVAAAEIRGTCLQNEKIGAATGVLGDLTVPNGVQLEISGWKDAGSNGVVFTADGILQVNGLERGGGAITVRGSGSATLRRLRTKGELFSETEGPLELVESRVDGLVNLAARGLFINDSLFTCDPSGSDPGVRLRSASRTEVTWSEFLGGDVALEGAPALLQWNVFRRSLVLGSSLTSMPEIRDNSFYGVIAVQGGQPGWRLALPNYFGSPGGTANTGWLGFQGAQSALPSVGVFSDFGFDRSCSLPDDRPVPWIRVEARYGQNVLGGIGSPSFSLVRPRAGRQTLFCFNLMPLAEQVAGAKYTLQLGGVDYSPVNPNHTARRDHGNPGHPTVPDRTLNFVIPDTVAAGTYTARLTADLSSCSGFEPGPSDQRLWEEQVVFDPPFGRPLRIGVTAIQLNVPGYVTNTDKGNPTNNRLSSLSKVMTRLKEDLLTHWPLTASEVALSDLGTYVSEGSWLAQKSRVVLAYALAAELEEYRQTYNATHSPPLDVVVAVVPATTLGLVEEGVSLRGYRKIAIVDEGSPGAALHELGHALGLYQGVTESEQYDLATGEDGAGNLILNGSGAYVQGVTAFNGSKHATKAFTGDIAHFPAMLNVNIYDFMGAKEPHWIVPSSLNVVYPALRELLGTKTSPAAPLATPARPRRPIALMGGDGPRLVRVHGLFTHGQDPADGSSFRKLIQESVQVTSWALTAEPTPIDNSDLYLDARLEALDDSGNRLSLQTLRSPWSALELHAGTVFPVSQVFEVPANTALLKVWNTNPFGQLAELLCIHNITKQPALAGNLSATMSANGLDVRWLATADSLSRPIQAQLLLNAGEGWTAVGTPTSTNRLFLPTNDLSGNIRLAMHVANAFDSIALDGPTFALPPKPPVVEILSPRSGDARVPGQTWQLEATLSGPGAGSWWSSRDGKLGDGSRLGDVLLSPGSHLLSFIATNAGLSTTGTVTVAVGPVPQADLRLEEADLVITPRGEDLTRHTGVRRLVPGRVSHLSLSVHNPGITNTTWVRLSVTPAGQPPLVLIDTNYAPNLTESIRLGVDYTPSTNDHTITAEVLALNLPDSDPANNTFSWFITNHPPTAFGLRLATTPGRELDLRLSGYDPELATLSYRLVRQPALGQLLGNAPNLTYVAGSHVGTDSFAFTVNDGRHESAPVEAVISVRTPSAPGAPTFLETVLQGVRQGEPLHYALKTGNDPLAFATWGLPAGLVLDHARGTIAGVPEVAGNQGFTLIAWNNVGATTQAFSGWFDSGAPVLTSMPSAAAPSGQPFAFQLTSSPAAEFYEVSGLPTGLGIEPATGWITGATAQDGLYTLGVTASNRWGKGYQLLELAVVPAARAQDYFHLRRMLTTVPTTDTTSTLLASRENDEPWHAGNYQLQGSVWWTWTAPADGPFALSTEGSDFDTVLAVYTGPDYRHLTAVAANDNSRWDTTSFVLFHAVAGTTYQIAVDGPARGTARLTLASHPQPFITSPVTHRAIATHPFLLQIEADNQPARFGAAGLPPGLTIDPNTGLISGTPVSKGGNWVTFTATNAYGSDSLRAYLEVMSAQYPVFTCPVHAAAEYGQPFEFDVTALHATAGYRAWPLPSGLSLDGVTGRISGTPWAAGVHRVTVDASNSAGELALLDLIVNVRLPYNLWIQNYVLPPGRQGPDDDADGDGMSNDNERMCGTNPQDPQDALAASISRSGDEYVLIWRSVPGHFYRAQSTTLVDSGLWEDGTEIEAVASTGRLPLPAAPGQFWRIRLIP